MLPLCGGPFCCILVCCFLLTEAFVPGSSIWAALSSLSAFYRGVLNAGKVEKKTHQHALPVTQTLWQGTVWVWLEIYEVIKTGASIHSFNTPISVTFIRTNTLSLLTRQQPGQWPKDSNCDTRLFTHFFFTHALLNGQVCNDKYVMSSETFKIKPADKHLTYYDIYCTVVNGIVKGSHFG